MSEIKDFTTSIVKEMNVNYVTRRLLLTRKALFCFARREDHCKSINAGYSRFKFFETILKVRRANEEHWGVQVKYHKLIKKMCNKLCSFLLTSDTNSFYYFSTQRDRSKVRRQATVRMNKNTFTASKVNKINVNPTEWSKMKNKLSGGETRISPNFDQTIFNSQEILSMKRKKYVMNTLQFYECLTQTAFTTLAVKHINAKCIARLCVWQNKVFLLRKQSKAEEKTYKFVFSWEKAWRTDIMFEMISFWAYVLYEAEVGAENRIPGTLCSVIKMNKHRGYQKADTITHLK